MQADGYKCNEVSVSAQLMNDTELQKHIMQMHSGSLPRQIRSSRYNSHFFVRFAGQFIRKKRKEQCEQTNLGWTRFSEKRHYFFDKFRDSTQVASLGKYNASGVFQLVFQRIVLLLRAIHPLDGQNEASTAHRMRTCQQNRKYKLVYSSVNTPVGTGHHSRFLSFDSLNNHLMFYGFTLQKYMILL